MISYKCTRCGEYYDRDKTICILDNGTGVPLYASVRVYRVDEYMGEVTVLYCPKCKLELLKGVKL